MGNWVRLGQVYGTITLDWWTQQKKDFEQVFTIKLLIFVTYFSQLTVMAFRNYYFLEQIA